MRSGEVPLTGGRVTIGVVRVGDTVRRPSTRNSPLARDLLLHLERQDFDGVPRFQGTDEDGRDILTYLTGDVPRDLAHFRDDQLTAAATLMRRFHDATCPFARLRQAGSDVICHNDWGPTNTVFRDDMPWAMIDFDTASPGQRLWDIGYSAFLWLDLGNPDYSGNEQARQASVFADAYDRTDCSPSRIVAFAIRRQLSLARQAALDGNPALGEWAAAAAVWTERHMTT